MEKLEIEKFSNFLSEIPPTEKIAFITSGGTLIDRDLCNCLEIQHFSTGKRACLCAEDLLIGNYFVVFLHRENSSIPFMHNLDMKTLFSKTLVEINELLFLENYKETFINYKRLFEKYSSRLFLTQFVTVKDYLLKKDSILKSLYPFQEKCLLILSAVNNFYYPFHAENLQVKLLCEDSEELTINLKVVDNQM